jgi:hypothetical protein
VPCDTRLKRGQTIQQRASEVRPQGGIAFTGLDDVERDGVTDACLFRRLMVSGSALAKQAIERAELMAGRKIDRQVIGQGGHYHGDVWHSHKG